MNKINILGSTGSIGKQAIEVCKSLGFLIESISCNSNIELLEKQIRECRPKFACVVDEEKAKELKLKIKDLDVKILAGKDGILESINEDDSEFVLNAIVGIDGLMPTIEAIKNNKNIATANKESIVVASSLLKKMMSKNSCTILPIDSEISAIYQCLSVSRRYSDIKRIILTASGGPFFGKNTDELKNISVDEALKHPVWKMGKKITIDSATLINKGFEIAESMFFFNKNIEDIDVLVHKQGIVHSMVEFIDNSILAQLSKPDMKLSIQYALTYPNRIGSLIDTLDLNDIKNLTFDDVDNETFKGLNYFKKSLRLGGLAPCMANAANDVAVNLFLDGKISFLEISELVNLTLNTIDNKINYELEDIFNKDKEVREFILSKI